MEHTLGLPIAENPYHISVIRGAFAMKGLPSIFQEMNDEITTAMEDALSQKVSEGRC